MDTTYFLGVAADSIDRAVLIADGNDAVVYCNAVFCEMFGYRRDEVIGGDPRVLIRREDIRADGIRRLHGALRDGRVFERGMLVTTAAGPGVVGITIRGVTEPGTGAEFVVLVFSDVDSSRPIRTLQHTVLQSIAEDRPIEATMELVCRQVEENCPGAVCSALRVSDGRVFTVAAPSLPASYCAAINGSPIGPTAGSCGAAAWSGQPVEATDIATDPLWADYRHLALSAGLRACWSSPVKLRDGRVAGTFAVYFREPRASNHWQRHFVGASLRLCSIALERAEIKSRIARLAYFDELTGLPNRVLLRERMSAALASEKGSAALFFVDIDQFKDVNDALGHVAGDSLIARLGRRIEALAGEGDIVGRFGGDEFVVLKPGASADAAAAAAERMLAALREPETIENVALHVSASIGISMFPADGVDSDALLKHADAAMYQAKGSGRSTFRFFNPTMTSAAQDRLLLGAALRQAIAGRALRFHYQPQIDARTGTLRGVEALARWSHPVFGTISPARFIALAEESGQIEALGAWGIEECCWQMADWRSRGIAIPSVSVNISPIHFRSRGFAAAVKAALLRHDLPPEMLTLELTERVILDDSAATIDTARTLDEQGVRLSMDDFGTGYSSLSHLARIPARELKIDRSFMENLPTDRGRGALVTAVIRIGQSLGMAVVAEGVETELQRQFLAMLGCDVLQGNLFSPALPAAALEAWAAARLAPERPSRAC